MVTFKLALKRAMTPIKSKRMRAYRIARLRLAAMVMSKLASKCAMTPIKTKRMRA